jgi:ParB family chromosome partitioning protein
VRETEALVRRWSISRGILRQPRARVDPNLAAVETELSTGLQTKVAIRAGRRRGQIVIEFYSPADLDRLVMLLLEAIRGPNRSSNLPEGPN